MPFEPMVRSRQMRARIRNKMAVLMLSMMQAVAGTWAGSWVRGEVGEWEKAALGREWDSFTPHLLLELASPRPQKWEQMERKKGSRERERLGNGQGMGEEMEGEGKGGRERKKGMRESKYRETEIKTDGEEQKRDRD